MGLAKLARSIFDRRTALDPKTLLGARPTRNSYVVTEELEDGSVLLKAPLSTQGRGVMGGLAKKLKKPDIKQFELEPIGAFVWSLCDGDNTFEGISRKLRERYKMNRLEADAALTAFLQMLSQRRLISLMVKDSK